MSGDRLRPEDIRYLALEGGGGKGFAYLGALQLLDDHKVLDQIKGVAGASAGAITALMISLGMSATEIGKKIDETDFTEFFDDPLPRLIPRAQIGTYQSSMAWPYAYVYPQDNEKELLMELYLGAPDVFNNFLNYLQDKDNSGGILSLPSWIILPGIVPIIRAAAKLEKFAGEMASSLGPPFNKLAQNFPKYFAHLQRDMGLFSGYQAREFLDKLIADRAAAVNGGDSVKYRNMSFDRHAQIFGRELLVCGTNLAIGKTVLFSPRSEHTPNFPVADAVRISMGLPLIYKPYSFTKREQGWPPCGTYVDGGLWNNIPLREIEPMPAEFRPAYVGQTRPFWLDVAKWPTQTLALRLQLDPPSPVLSALDVMTQMLKQVVGTGESQVLEELDYMCVTLDTSDLSLLQFKPKDDVRKTVTKRSRRAIARYFGWPIDNDDQDDPDDKRTQTLQSATVCSS